MAFCPLDYRYGNQDFKHIWSESVDTNANSKLNVRSFGHIGNSVACLKTITMQWLPSPTPNLYVKNGSQRSKRNSSRHHGFDKAMAEAAGDAGWCIHLGATSNDIVDTAVALQLRDSIVLLREQLCLLIGVCADVAERERDTVMLGRTHGQAAVPITLASRPQFGWMKCDVS